MGRWQQLSYSTELLKLLVWREIKLRYKQTLLGMGWALLQPLASMAAFTVVFHGIAGIDGGGIPYPILAFAGLLPWLFISKAIAGAGHSLVNNAELVTQIYFPRYLLPVASVLAHLADFAVAFVWLLAWMLLNGNWPGLVGWAKVILVVATLVLLAIGIALWIGSLHVFFRDTGHASTYLLQLWVFFTPVAYPLKAVPTQWKVWIELNPLAPLVEGFRASLFSLDWNFVSLVWPATITLLLLSTGSYFFGRVSNRFADTI